MPLARSLQGTVLPGDDLMRLFLREEALVHLFDASLEVQRA